MLSLLVKILSKVVKEAKRLMYNNQVINCANKMKTTWNIIKIETNRINSKYQNSLETFNKYFLSVADEIIQDIKKKVNNKEDLECYLSKLSQTDFPNIKFKNTSTKEIDLSDL
jgi:chloramphenicol O-acetyltransferase